MKKILAEKMVKLLMEAYNRHFTHFELQLIHNEDEELKGFHHLADGHEHVGVIKSSLFEKTLYLVFIKWNETAEYYLVIFNFKKNKILAELHKTENVDGKLDLCWSYSPTKQDGKNKLRQEKFEKYYGNLCVKIRVPERIDEVDSFLTDILVLTENRIKAEELNSQMQYRYGFPEGKVLEEIHKTKERSFKLVEIVKNKFKAEHAGKLECSVCGFDFVDTYGELGTDFIEAHHTIPVSELKENQESKIKDMVVVCSNCHRMLHRRRPWLKINELKKILNNKTE